MGEKGRESGWQPIHTIKNCLVTALLLGDTNKLFDHTEADVVAAVCLVNHNVFDVSGL